MVSSVPSKEKQDTEFWHNILGHAFLKSLSQNFHFSQNNCRSQLGKCVVCPLGRHTRLSFPDSTSRTCEVFSLFYIDVWGPYNVQTFDDNKLYLTIVDDHSRMTWLYLLKLKSDVVVMPRNFIKLIQNQFNRTIKAIRSDNRGGFLNNKCSDLLQYHEIVYQKTYVYTAQQNGIVERKYRHILKVARALRLQRGIPLRY